MIQQKRYQRFTVNGIEWSEWFDYDGPQEPWQLKINSRMSTELLTKTKKKNEDIYQDL